jgi:hemerythrin-like domain-containing protein
MRNPDLESAIERLEPLEDEHRLAGPLHAEVEELGQQCLTTGNLSSTKAAAFGKAIAGLLSMYKQHINIEDNVVFPLATRLLSLADIAAIAAEMAARRKVRLSASVSNIPYKTVRDHTLVRQVFDCELPRSSFQSVQN